MKVLLLGKTGFVGRNLFEQLQDDNLQIEAPSRQEVDMLDERAVIRCLKKGAYDVVLNCLDIHAESAASYAELRLRMFYNLAQHADLFGKMVYFGTGAEYGRQLPLEKIEESSFGRVIPQDSYGFAMYQMTQYALKSENIFNLRLFGIFGKYEKWQTRFISNCICKALCKYPLTLRQDRVMDYLYIDDLVKIVRWAICETPYYHAYNATSGARFHLASLAAKVLEEAGETDKLPIYIAKEGLWPEYTSSNELLKKCMGGFEPKAIECSIRELMSYYREHEDIINREQLLYQ